MAKVNLEVSFISFHDDNCPGSHITDNNGTGTFVVTTGGFPQEVVLTTRAASAKMSKITLMLNDAKEIIVEKSVTSAEMGGVKTYEILAERTLDRGGSSGGLQTEVLDVDPSGAGRDVTALRLTIVSGYSEFVGIYSVEAIGEESQQRVAVMESKPEINM